jgi:hypothetical protein
MAAAIARAEGWGVPDTLPTRCCNPGDLELGDRGWGVEQGKTIYQKTDFGADLQDKTDGASALRRECLAILSGASHIYQTTWTFLQLAQEWTGGDDALDWCRTVCEALEVSQDTTLASYSAGCGEASRAAVAISSIS